MIALLVCRQSLVSSPTEAIAKLTTWGQFSRVAGNPPVNGTHDPSEQVWVTAAAATVSPLAGDPPGLKGWVVAAFDRGGHPLAWIAGGAPGDHLPAWVATIPDSSGDPPLTDKDIHDPLCINRFVHAS